MKSVHSISWPIAGFVGESNVFCGSFQGLLRRSEWDAAVLKGPTATLASATAAVQERLCVSSQQHTCCST